MSNSTNKSQRPLGNQFDGQDINKIFEQKENEKEQEMKQQFNLNKQPDEIAITLSPHQRSMEEIIISIRELFFKVLEMLIDKQNPIPYIFSSEIRQFSFSLFLIIMGFILLLFSSVMKNAD